MPTVLEAAESKIKVPQTRFLVGTRFLASRPQPSHLASEGLSAARARGWTESSVSPIFSQGPHPTRGAGPHLNLITPKGPPPSATPLGLRAPA